MESFDYWLSLRPGEPNTEHTRHTLGNTIDLVCIPIFLGIQDNPKILPDANNILIENIGFMTLNLLWNMVAEGKFIIESRKGTSHEIMGPHQKKQICIQFGVYGGEYPARHETTSYEEHTLV